jgi:hypothetical protein
MFVGHLALGLAAKPATPRVSLAVLLTASQLADILWPFFLAIGLEQVRIAPGITAFTPLDFVSYPYSHSLVMLVVWGLVFGAIYRMVTGRNGRVFIVLAALVVSHWILDWISHRPDMPIYPGGPKFGLGLWNHVAATIIVEGIMFAAGIWIYVRATRARDAVGRWGFVSLMAFLAVLYVVNAISSPPPSVNAIVIMAIAGFTLLTAWSWWADHHRDVILTGPPGRQP